MRKHYPNKALIKVLQHLRCSQRDLARLCDVRPQVITWWLQNHVPAGRVLHLEKLVSGAVLRSEIRPDIYPPHEEQD